MYFGLLVGRMKKLRLENHCYLILKNIG